MRRGGHECCAVDNTRVSRRNHISEFFLKFTKDGVAHFHIELRVLKYIPSHENVQVNIRSHQTWEEVTKCERGRFISVTGGDIFYTGDNSLDEAVVEPKDAQEFGAEDT